METIFYRNIRLDVIQSLLWEREPMFDASNTTYLDTRWRGSVIVSYNPGANSFIPGNPVPTPSAGKFPAETDVAIRRYLEQPRGALVVTALGVDVINMPNAGTVCDTRNGPFLRVNSIQHIQGERLWKIHLEFETYINEHPKERQSNLPPLFLSNRWYAIDDVDWQHRRTRIYQGVCTVRGDGLQMQLPPDRYVDRFRSTFAAFAVQPGYQREKVHVVVDPDGNTAHYTVIDTEQLFDKGENCPSVRVEVAETSWMWTGSFTRAVAQSGILGAWTQGVGLVIGDLVGDRWAGLNAGQVAGSIITGTAQANLPKVYRNVLVRCWGNRVTNRVSLVNYGLAVVAARLGRPFVIDTTTTEIIVTQDTNNFVQINTTINWGGDLAANQMGGNIFGGVVAGLDLFSGGGLLLAQRTFNNFVAANPNTNRPAIPGNPAVGNIPASGPQPAVSLQQSSRLPNPPFPAGAGVNVNSGTRGTSALNFPSGPIVAGNIPPPSVAPLFVLVTQSLEGFDANPAPVP